MLLGTPRSKHACRQECILQQCLKHVTKTPQMDLSTYCCSPCIKRTMDWCQSLCLKPRLTIWHEQINSAMPFPILYNCAVLKTQWTAKFTTELNKNLKECSGNGEINTNGNTLLFPQYHHSCTIHQWPLCFIADKTHFIYECLSWLGLESVLKRVVHAEKVKGTFHLQSV